MIIALLLAAATPAERPLPRIAPADAAAQFQGDVGTIKFDPACRDYTLTTVATSPACAQRVASGETAPTLAIVARTIAEEPARTSEALAALNRAVARENHPAAHYLLGSLLGGGEIRPDYGKAVQHLAFASDHGNPAAADLLAKLTVEGKGTPRDIPRAIKLYEQALAGGFPANGWRLASLYLDGRFMPKDEDYGRRLLQALAATGDRRAAQLSAMLLTPTQNVQLLPSPEEGAVRVKAYGVFDNPTIPPAFGNDEAFQKIYDTEFDNPATLTMLERDASKMPTPYLYELTRRLAPKDPAAALRTYFLARLRLTYDASRCADWSALEAISAWDGLVMPDIRFAIRTSTPEIRAQAAREALKLEATMPGDQRPWWVCRSGMAAMQNALSGQPGPLALKPEAEWPALRADARRPIEALAADGLL